MKYVINVVYVLVFLASISWFNNIHYVLDSDFSDVSGREIISVLGIPIAPLGIANGFVYIFEDEKVN